MPLCKLPVGHFSSPLGLLHSKGQCTVILMLVVGHEPVAPNLFECMLPAIFEGAFLPTLSSGLKHASLVLLSPESKVSPPQTPVDAKFFQIRHLGAMAPVIAAHLPLAIICMEIPKTFAPVPVTASLIEFKPVGGAKGRQYTE
ncbi:hypothetical protein G3M48_007842 [Beauveria asiatica]|uniref:Uncharacterized protein n=1 Tax=Beauveria asiatica TaxID=1069075 RepID=A0AAW0RLU3_9HYPO